MIIKKQTSLSNDYAPVKTADEAKEISPRITSKTNEIPKMIANA
jgi:hypothetical protein